MKNLVACLVAVFALVAVASGRRQEVGPKGPETIMRFERDAGGSPAAEDRRLVVRAAAAGSFGLINGISFCPGVAYFSDPWRVYEVNLIDGRVNRTIAETPAASQNPNTIAAGIAVDCEAGVLYRVEHRRGVRVVRLSDGDTVRWLPKPDVFVIASSGNILLERGRLVVPGLWPPAPGQHTKNGRPKFYESARLGWSVDVATGRSEPQLDPLDPSCESAAPAEACLASPVDRWAGGDDAYWAYAHGSGTSFGIADKAGARVTRVSVRSPRFTRDERAPTSSSQTLEESLRWGTSNSLIHRVFASAQSVAVAHSLYATTTLPVQFIVHVNLYDRAGKGLISDLRLPDLAIGRDSTNLYVIDYGSGGRREGATELTLVGVPLNASRHFQSLNRR